MRETLRLLVVTADHQARRTTARLLRACGAGEVREARTGDEALDAMSDGFAPDVLLLDAELGLPSGAEFCRRLRAREGVSQPDVWLLAPEGMSTPVLEALDAGADDVLGLPVVPQLLQARLRLVSRRRERAKSPVRLVEALLAAREEGTGELVVRATTSQRSGRVYFYGGRVVWVHVEGETSTLTDLLTGSASIDERTARGVLEQCRQQATPLSIALEHAGIIERPRWRSCVQAWSRQRLQRLATFAPSSSVFLPHEFRLEDDISFTLSELLGDLHSSLAEL